MRRSYRYSRATIARAYVRSAVGLVVTLGPLVALRPSAFLSGVLLVGAALFLTYLAWSIALHTRSIVLDEAGMRAEGLFGASIGWDALRTVHLNYYTTRNDRSQGWIELDVRGARGTIRLESHLAGFDEIAACVIREAVARDCPLDDRTLTHLAVLGIEHRLPSRHHAHSLAEAHHG
jgi:hypothetical protein